MQLTVAAQITPRNQGIWPEFNRTISLRLEQNKSGHVTTAAFTENTRY
jgi:hypothetical protein